MAFDGSQFGHWFAAWSAPQDTHTCKKLHTARLHAPKVREVREKQILGPPALGLRWPPGLPPPRGRFLPLPPPCWGGGGPRRGTRRTKLKLRRYMLLHERDIRQHDVLPIVDPRV